MARTSVLQKLGQRVKCYRQQAGITQEKLGHETGLDRGYISRVERGVQNPSLRSIEKIAKALKVRVSDLTDF